MSSWNYFYPGEGTTPLCGQDWLDKHRNDHTQAEIDSLGIELRVCGKVQTRVQSGQRKDRGIVRDIVRLNKER